MVNAYIENSYKLVFPLFCEGYLNLDYDPAVVTLEEQALAASGEIQHPVTLESTGVLVNGAINDNSTTNIAVDTVDATTKFEVGDNVYDADNALVGVVSAVTATQITLAANNDEELANNENLKKNITTTTELRERGIWAHDSNFVIEAIITPYDVNGAGSRASGKHGVLDSQKTPPYPTDALGSRTSYESVDYLGTSAYLTQKMMLFHNTNLKLYLQNTTSSSYNQPAEYKVVAELTKGGTTKTIQSDTVIKAVDSLQGYYDATGYYDDMTTGYQLVSSSATGSNPQGTITVSDYNDLEVNAKATGQVAIGADDIANYVSPVAATGSYTIANANSIPCNTPPVYATAKIKVMYVQQPNTNPGAYDWVGVLNSGGDVYKFFQFNSGGQVSNGSVLDSGTYGALAFGFVDGGGVGMPTTTDVATNLAAAINAVAGNGEYSLDCSATSSGSAVSLTSTASTPVNHNNDTNTRGSGMTNSHYIPYGWATNNNGDGDLVTGVNEVEDIEFITITSNDASSTVKKYKASTDPAHTTGQVITDSASNQCVLFKIGANAEQTAASLRTAILHSNGHNGKITVSNSGTTRTLTQATVGAGGNNTITRTTGITNTHVTIAGFTGGVTEANATNTPYIQIIDSAGTPVTKKYVPVANGDAIATSATQTIGDVSGAVAFQEGANANATGANLATAINHSNGHNGSIVASNSSGTVSLTQGTVGTGGNTTITLSNTSNVTKSNFTGGATPDNFISITDAAGTLKKYKASTIEVTGTTDGTYTFFRAETNNNTTAANLETAIDGANGHNGTIITTRANNVVTAKLNQAAMGSAAMSDNITDLTATNFSAGTSDQINVGSGEAEELGAGSKIYDSSANLLGTVSSVSGDTITLASAPSSTVGSTIYTNQLREALYLEQVYKVSLVYNNNTLELYLNDELIKKESHTITSFKLDPSDCKIGRGANNAEQFFGELYEIAMHKGKRPSATQKTLTPGYSDIMFYYTFGG